MNEVFEFVGEKGEGGEDGNVVFTQVQHPQLQRGGGGWMNE